MFRQFTLASLTLLALIAARPEARAEFFPPGPAPTLGTVRVNDQFGSVFALSADGTWVGFSNNRGAPSFIAFSLRWGDSHSSGTWAYQRRARAVALFGPDGRPLLKLHGLRPRAPAVQSGLLTLVMGGPPLTWTFIPQ